jgi:putative ABC transport system permease protein
VSTPSWRRYLRFWRSDLRADLDDELRFHLESRVQEYLDLGMSPDEARAEAARRLGDLEPVRRSCERIDHLQERERRRADMWQTITQDLRYALRALRRNPGFTLVAVLTLALGIGANTAIFSVVNGVILRPLPYPAADRLVRLFTAYRGHGIERYAVSEPEFMDYRGLTQAFENAAAFEEAGLTITGGCAAGGSCEPERLRGIAATRELIPVLGIRPERGRNFEGEEGRQGTEPVVIVTHQLWMNRLGGDPAALGRSITLNGISRRVIGILPPDFAFAQAQAIVPKYIDPDSLAGRALNYLGVVARLRPAVSLEQAQRELNALTARTEKQYPGAYATSMGYGATVVGLQDEMVGDVRPALLVLLGAVGLVLLIACANVANLLLARGEARQREVAVRLALGASRGRVLLQLLTESTVLAIAGAIGGVLLAWWGMKALLAVNPAAIPRLEEIQLDATVGLVTLGVAVLTGILFGLAPSIQLVRGQLQPSLKEGSRGGSASGRRQRLGRSLVVGEVALAVIVVIGAGLLLRSFRALRNVDPGFDPENVLVVDLAIPPARYDGAATVNFYRRLLERMGALPGVRVTAAASDVPPDANGNNWDIEIDGRPLGSGKSAPSPNVRIVTRDFFRVLAVGVRQGRLFDTGDRLGTMPVAVINESLARALWPDGDAIGTRVRFSPRIPWITIVGVARDMHSEGLGAPAPMEIYLLHDQMKDIAGDTQRAMYVLLRTAVDPLTLAAAARRVVAEADPSLAITGIATLSQMVDRSLARPRFLMLLLGAFGALALLLAAIGIYGIMAYAVRRRTREIGIRMALGARPGDVLGLVVAQGMRLAAIGLLVGILGALLATRLMEKLLFGVSATDPVTFATIALLLGGVALFASWLPARRAVLTDPTAALREE